MDALFIYIYIYIYALLYFALHLHLHCSICKIAPVYPPPRPVHDMTVCLVPGCGGLYKHTEEGSGFYNHKKTGEHKAAVKALHEDRELSDSGSGASGSESDEDS